MPAGPGTTVTSILQQGAALGSCKGGHGQNHPRSEPWQALSAPCTLGSDGQLGGASRARALCSPCPQLVREEAVAGADIQELLATLNLDLKQPVEQVSAWGSLGRLRPRGSCPSPASPKGLT